MSSIRYYEPEILSNFSNKVFSQFGVPERDAKVVTDCLLYADLHGHSSHGIVRLPVYSKRLVTKVVNAIAKPAVEHVFNGICVVNGDNGLGPIVGKFGMLQAIELANRFGIGMAVARLTNHFGPAAFYTEMALEQNCIAIAASNAPPNMAPCGGRERFLGTNPLSVAVPAGKKNPVIFDMASSVVARGNIILAAQKGEPIPEGWALDPDGNPTTDSHLGLLGAVLPFGGAKGAAISLLIDIFAGVLSGASFARHLNTLEDLGNVQNLGHFFIAIEVGKFMPIENFKERMDDLITQLKETPKAPGILEVFAPGEIELRKKAKILSTGIPVSDDVYKQLIELGSQVDVTLDKPLEIREEINDN